MKQRNCKELSWALILLLAVVIASVPYAQKARMDKFCQGKGYDVKTDQVELGRYGTKRTDTWIRCRRNYAFDISKSEDQIWDTQNGSRWFKYEPS